MSLDELTVKGWDEAARKSLLFVCACSLPTSAIRARHLAFASSPALASEVRERKRREEQGRPPPIQVSQWEVEFLTGLAQLLEVDAGAVTTSVTHLTLHTGESSHTPKC